MEKLIITAALTGAITVPTQSKYPPYTIAADAIACGLVPPSFIFACVTLMTAILRLNSELFGEVVTRISRPTGANHVI